METVKVYTYRYIWQKEDGSLCCRYLTETEKVHEAFMDSIKEDATIRGAYREYVNEIDYGKINMTDTFKEVTDNEKV